MLVFRLIHSLINLFHLLVLTHSFINLFSKSLLSGKYFLPGTKSVSLRSWIQYASLVSQENRLIQLSPQMEISFYNFGNYGRLLLINQTLFSSLRSSCMYFLHSLNLDMVVKLILLQQKVSRYHLYYKVHSIKFLLCQVLLISPFPLSSRCYTISSVVRMTCGTFEKASCMKVP